MMGFAPNPWKWVALFMLLCMGCGPGESAPPAETPVESQEASTEAQAVPATLRDPSVLDGNARRLAGLDGDEGPWVQHKEEMTEIWQGVESQHLEPMEGWAQGALEALEPADAPLFYPFGGPDLSSARQFFPDARHYVLVGLEPPGLPPHPELLAEEDLGPVLERLRSGFKSFGESGYFVARSMGQDFATDQGMGGLLPVLYITLAREGFTLRSLRYFTLEDDGTPVFPETVAASTAQAVRLELGTTDDPDAPTRILDYLAQDLGDEGLAASPGFLAYLDTLGSVNVYMKAAMYLPHRDDFSRFVSWIDQRAANLLQDDSGLPFRALVPDRWNVRLFGVYTGTLNNYQEWYQEDLEAAYANQAEEPLEFLIGYNRRISGSVLIWAGRR